MIGAIIILTIIITSLYASTQEQPVLETTKNRFLLNTTDFENSQNLKLLPQTNLNKNDTQYLGFIFHSYSDIIDAENPGQKFSIRFTPKFSGELSNVLLPISARGNKVTVGLYEDEYGFPAKEALATSDSYITPLIIPTSEVHGFNFTQNIPITAGKVYHIVVDPTLANNTKITLRIYDDSLKINPLNHTDPDVTWIDKSLNTLFYDGKSWIDTGYLPVYVINYSNGITDGQPYTLFAPWNIGKERYVGQAVIPYSTYKINEISFVVAKKGSPSDDLYYAIYDSNDKLLRDGLYAKKEELSSFPTWWSKPLSPVMMESGNLYRVVLYSPKSTLDDGFQVYGHEFMLDKTLGYGSTIHHLTVSFNGLESWIEWYDADAAFKFSNESR